LEIKSHRLEIILLGPSLTAKQYRATEKGGCRGAPSVIQRAIRVRAGYEQEKKEFYCVDIGTAPRPFHFCFFFCLFVYFAFFGGL